MKLDVKPGKYVVAVSGGLDSVALLHMLLPLARNRQITLVVAHFEHGVRADSDQDRLFVQELAEGYGLPFVYARGHLGPGASEATARAARYDFLKKVQAAHAADAIMTAHHQDDHLETALINLLRGTGGRGLGGVRSEGGLLRPLLPFTKQQLREYAAHHNLQWREDSTNADERYLRNYLRRRVVPTFTPAARQQLLQHISAAAELHAAIEQELAPWTSGHELDRAWFTMLPYDVSAEAMALWLRRNGLYFDRKTIHRLTVFAKTAAPDKRADVGAGHTLVASKNHITLGVRPAKG